MTEADGGNGSYRVAIYVSQEKADEVAFISREIEEFLSGRGVAVVVPETTPIGLDALVVLLVAGSNYEELWPRDNRESQPRHIVPVRIGDVASGDLPAELSEIQWLTWAPEAKPQFYGELLATLRRDPDGVRRKRELDDEATAWARQGHDDAMVIVDLHRALEMSLLLEESAGNASVPLSDTTRQFVARSIEVSRRRRKKLRRRWVGAVAALFIAAAIGVPAGLRLQGLSQSNGQSFVTSGELTASALPEWSALLSGALLIDGDQAQKALARETLLDTMVSTPYWGLGPIDVGTGYAVEDVFPASAPGSVGVLVGVGDTRSDLATYQLRTGQLSVRTSIQGSYWFADSLDAGQTVTIAGPSGVAFISSRTDSIRRVVGPSSITAAVSDSNRQLSYVVDGTKIYTASVGYGSHLVGSYVLVLDVERVAGGRLQALVETHPGDYQVIDATTGAVILAASLPPPTVAEGGLGRGGNAAYVAGADGQIWALTPTAAEPTGIPVTDRDDVIAELPGDRLLVGGWAEEAEVYELPSGVALGEVCSDDPRLNEVKSFDAGAVISCQGGAQTTLWPTPPGPVAPSTIRWLSVSKASSAGSAGVRVESQGGALRIRQRRGGRVDTTPWISLFPDPITAVALAPGGKTAVIGTSSGEVAVMSLGAHIQVVGLWNSPGRMAARIVGFDPGPVVVDAGGQAWQVPQCSGCNTDAGLLTQLGRRLSGCWLQHQLVSVDQAIRDRFGIELCRPLDGLVGT